MSGGFVTRANENSRRQQRAGGCSRSEDRLVELPADELHQLLIAHGIRGALSGDGVFELRGIPKVVDELLLNRAGAGDVDLLGIRQQCTDFFEILLNQGDLQVVRGAFVRIATRPGVFSVAKNGEFGVARSFIAYDRRVVGIHPNTEPLFVFY